MSIIIIFIIIFFIIRLSLSYNEKNLMMETFSKHNYYAFFFFNKLFHA